MNEPPREFFVDGWVEGESGNFTVIGCCGESPIRINDNFDVIFRYKRRKYPEEMADESIREEEVDASLRIDGIQAYGRSLKMLGQGMTGSIVVSGVGVEQISAGKVLGTRNGRDHGSQNGQAG